MGNSVGGGSLAVTLCGVRRGNGPYPERLRRFGRDQTSRRNIGRHCAAGNNHDPTDQTCSVDLVLAVEEGRDLLAPTATPRPTTPPQNPELYEVRAISSGSDVAGVVIPPTPRAAWPTSTPTPSPLVSSVPWNRLGRTPHRHRGRRRGHPEPAQRRKRFGAPQHLDRRVLLRPGPARQNAPCPSPSGPRAPPPSACATPAAASSWPPTTWTSTNGRRGSASTWLPCSTATG